MTFAIIFLISFLFLAAFAFYLSKTIEHGEARFDSTTGKVIPDGQTADESKEQPEQQPESKDKTGNEA